MLNSNSYWQILDKILRLLAEISWFSGGIARVSVQGAASWGISLQLPSWKIFFSPGISVVSPKENELAATGHDQHC